MKSTTAYRTDRQLRIANNAQILANNADLLTLYASALGMTEATLLQSMHDDERDLSDDRFPDRLSDHAERLAV